MGASALNGGHSPDPPIGPLCGQQRAHAPQQWCFTLPRLFLSRANAASRRKGDLEKINTIGDAYMLAACLPEPRSDHVQAAIEMAMAMQRYLETVAA
jgi:Adenylate and Guanylate cyclase catalytic domain